MEDLQPGGQTAATVKVAAPPAWIFALLVLPAAALSNGFVGTALASMLRSERMPLADIANVLALLQLPPMLYFLWSPLVDFWLRHRTWVALSASVAGLLLFVALQFDRLGGLSPEILLFVAMSVAMLTNAGLGALMATVVPPEKRTRVSSFYQVGNVGFAALAGGGILYLSQQLNRHLFGLVCGLLIALPGLLSLTIAEPGVVGRGEAFSGVLRRIGREFRHTFFKWDAVPVLMMLGAPFGSGAAISLLPGMAPDYGISVDQVAWMNGLGGGLLTALGALLIGFLKLPDDLRPVYASLGLINALTLGVLLLGHPRPVTYLASAALYLVTIGACYAVFTALVLKLLGLSGKSGGSRYAIALSIGNAPIFYMVVVDGLGARWFGVKGLPGIDMAVSGSAALGFLGWFWWQRRRGIQVELGLAEVEPVEFGLAPEEA